MPISLPYLSEAIFVAMVNEKPDAFLRVAQLSGVDAGYFFAGKDIAFREVRLLGYGGREFDGASRVDVVVSIAPAVATPFELKLGTTRLSKSRIDAWLTDCKTSHKDKRWSGNMMAILDRRFGEPALAGDLAVDVAGVGRFALTRGWFVVARKQVLLSWRKAKPDFSDCVRCLAFEDLVEEFGGQAAFNELVSKLLTIDFYKAWVKESE